jgi:hypothetical protein
MIHGACAVCRKSLVVAPGAELCSCVETVDQAYGVEGLTIEKKVVDPDTCSIQMVNLGVNLEIYRSKHDGAVVVQIDTPELEEDSGGPTGLRVYLNDDMDDPIWGLPVVIREHEDTLGGEPTNKEQD